MCSGANAFRRLPDYVMPRLCTRRRSAVSTYWVAPDRADTLRVKVKRNDSRMKRVSTEYLQIGDRVGFSSSNVPASGVVIEDMGPDYVRVQWLDCGLATTHRRHGLERQRATRLSKWTLKFRPAKPQQARQSHVL